jgi:hypothetical protein
VADAAYQSELQAALLHGFGWHFGFHIPMNYAFNRLHDHEVSGSG